MALAPNSRLADLTNAIIKSTEGGKIIWEKTSIEGVYSTNLGNYVVQISEQGRPRGDPDYVITLYDNFGEQVEKFADTDISGHDAAGYDGFFAAMRQLYRSAALQASGANEAIIDILRFLDEQ